MITLNEVKEFLDKCETDNLMTAVMNDDGCLEIYRFDGDPMDDDVLVAKVDEEFTVTTTDGSICPFNYGEGYIEDIENATVKDIASAILYNIKTIIADEICVTVEHMKWIDRICEKNGIDGLEVETYNGQKY